MMLDVIWVPEFARAGWVLDLTPGLHPGELAPYFPSTVAAAADHGRVWALPWNMNVGLLYYRADLLGKYGLAPPETFDELARQVVRIRAGERDPALDGYLLQAKQYEGLVVNVLEAFWANGTRLLADDGTLFPEPGRAAEALRFLRGLIASGAAPSPTREALYHDPGLVRSRPELPALHALMRAGRSRPVTPYYLLLSSTVQPEFSAVLVGLKAPARAIGDARLRLSHFLDALR